MKRQLLFLLTLVMTFTAAFSQAPGKVNPVSWNATVKMTSKTEGVLTVTATIEDKWHLYALKLPSDAGPRPTQFKFDGTTGVTFVNEVTPVQKPITKHDEMFDADLSFWNKTVTFTRKFKLTGKKADAKIEGVVSYMACNDVNCMPPKKFNFSLTIK